MIVFAPLSFAQQYRTFKGCFAEDGVNYFATTSDGYWLKSTDGGLNWTAYRLPFAGIQNLAMFDTHMISSDEGWIIGSLARVFYTDNGGWDFIEQTSGAAKWAARMDVINDTLSWIALGEGRMLYTQSKGFPTLDNPWGWQTQETWLFGVDLYGVSIKRLNEQVKRNIERFLKEFMF